MEIALTALWKQSAVLFGPGSNLTGLRDLSGLARTIGIISFPRGAWERETKDTPNASTCRDYLVPTLRVGTRKFIPWLLLLESGIYSVAVAVGVRNLFRGCCCWSPEFIPWPAE
jgi:hypothetical protein